MTEKKHKAETHCFQVSEGFRVEEKLDSRIITEEELESMSQYQDRFAFKIKCFLKLNELMWASCLILSNNRKHEIIDSWVRHLQWIQILIDNVNIM